MDFETSLPHEMAAEMDRMPVAYLPWGAHEWHGAHNPVGLDGVKARFLAEELCKEVGGIVFPTVYCGHSTLNTVAPRPFPYTFEFNAPLVSNLAREYVERLGEAGFRVIVVVMGHWGQHHGEVMRGVAAEYNVSHPNARAWAVQEDEMIEPFGYGEDHGGLEETSFIAACLPGRVELFRLPDRELSFEEDGIIGSDPRAASYERGIEATQVYVREAARRIREMLDELA